MNAPIRHQGLPVVWRERPFADRLHRHYVPPALRMPTIAEIVASCEPLPRGFAQYGEVRVNGNIIPRDVWHLVRPKYRPGFETVVSLHTPLRGGGGGGSGGGGGGKSGFATVAAIAVLLVAAAVSGGALGPAGLGLLGASFASGGLGASIAAAGIGIAGALAIAALTPPPTLAAAGADPISSSADPSTRNASAASLSGNVLSPGAPIPRVIGTMRVFPPLLCNPLIEVVGDMEYAEAVFGLSGPHALSTIRVGGTLLDSLTDVTSQRVEGRPGDAIQTLVTRQSYTNNIQAELQGHILNETTQTQLHDQINPATSLPQAQTLTSRKSPDEIWINLAFPEGLFKGDSLSTVVNVAVRLQVRLRGNDTYIKLPEIHFSMNTPGSFQKVIRLKWDDIPAAQSTPPDNQGPVYAFKHVPAQAVSPATTDWDADAHFSAGSGNDVLKASTVGTTNVRNVELYDDKVIFYLDEATFPKGVYEIQVLRSIPYDNSALNTANYQYSGTIRDLFAYYDSGGFSIIPIDHAQYHDRMAISRVSSVWNENPVQSSDFATISVRVHSRSLDNLSVLASGYVNDWGGSAWDNLVTTSSPAAHLYEVLTGALGAGALPPALVDSAGIVAWRTHCATMGYVVNAVIEGKRYPDVINMICSAGYARIRHSETWGVLLDQDRSADAPVQIFNPRNMANFQWTRAFAQRPSGLRANYQNASDDYASEEIFVYDDPGNQDADRLEVISYEGLVTEAAVTARANFDLDQSRRRFTFYSGDVDVEAIVCQRGDLIGVQHDILIKSAGFSRIVSVVRDENSPELISGLVLDGTVPVNRTDGIYAIANLFVVEHIFDLGLKTGVAIRLKNGSGMMVKEVSAAVQGHTRELSFVSAFDDPGTDLGTDCLVSAGPLGQEYLRLLVQSITPKNDLEATLIMVDEAPELWN